MLDSERKQKNESRVDVHSILTVVSSTPVSPGLVHKLSVLDHSMALHSLHLVYYYRNNPGGPFDLDKLRMSLSEVLSMYPPVTGRLARDHENGNKWEVNCNDAGVRVLKANVDVTIDEWLESADGYEERHLTAWENMPQDPSMWSPFRIQMNDFVGGGLAIGLSCSHMHTDITFAATLFEAWTMAHRHQPIPHPPSYKGLRRHTSDYTVASQQLDPSPAKMATATFKFSDSVIRQSLAEIHLQCATATPFDLLAAIFWRSVEDSKKSDVKEKHSLSICMDFRKVLSESLPLGYFGNAQHFSQLSVTDKELNDADWLPHIAKLINHSTCSVNDSKIQSAMNGLECWKSNEGKCNEASSFRMYGPELICISTEHLINPNSSRSIVYETMFEEGERPIHVSCHIGNAQGKGQILIMPSPDEGLSRMVMVTLPADQLAKVCGEW